MNNEVQILKWGTDCLIANGYSAEGTPETVLSTLSVGQVY